MPPIVVYIIGTSAKNDYDSIFVVDSSHPNPLELARVTHDKDEAQSTVERRERKKKEIWSYKSNTKTK